MSGETGAAAEAAADADADPAASRDAVVSEMESIVDLNSEESAFTESIAAASMDEVVSLLVDSDEMDGS